MNNETKREVISIYVDNQANVLARVVSLYGRRGFNIDSLTVSETTDPTISRITVVFKGTEQGLAQILSQTEKLEVVRRIFVLEGWLTSLIGLVVGLLAGLGLALLQQKLGIIKMPGSFALDAYPVIVSGADILLTAASVALVGLLISLAALKNLER